jgi:hypothetical protein
MSRRELIAVEGSMSRTVMKFALGAVAALVIGGAAQATEVRVTVNTDRDATALLVTIRWTPGAMRIGVAMATAIKTATTVVPFLTATIGSTTAGAVRWWSIPIGGVMTTAVSSSRSAKMLGAT